MSGIGDGCGVDRGEVGTIVAVFASLSTNASGASARQPMLIRAVDFQGAFSPMIIKGRVCMNVAIELPEDRGD